MQVAPFAKLTGDRRRRRAHPDEGVEAAVTIADGLKAAALLFVAAIVQVSILTQIHVLGGVPDVLLVTLVAVALLRGAIVGAAGGFFAGLLVDTATLGQLGLTSLVLTVAGYWIGRYGETTGRDRAHAPFLSVAVVTILYAFGLLLVHFVLGEPAPAGAMLEGLGPGDRAQPHPDRAGVRARAPAAARARAVGSRDRGAAPWLAPPAAAARSRKFLPPSTGVAEPYRLTPRLALRVAILSGILARRLRGALPPPVGAAGARGDEVRRPGAGELATAPCACRRRAARSSTATATSSSTNVPATAVELWPSDLPKVYTARYAELRALAHVTRVPLYEIAAGIKVRRVANDPITPVTIREDASEPMVTYLDEHSSQFPGVDDRADVHPPLPVQLARCAGARLRRRDLCDGAAEARQERLPARRRDRAGRRRGLVRHVPPRRRRRGAPPHRRSRPAAQRHRADGSVHARSHGAADARPHAPAGGGEGARSTGSSSRRRAASGLRGGGAIVAMDPQERLDPRARVRAGVPAVGLHGARDGEGARRSRA